MLNAATMSIMTTIKGGPVIQYVISHRRQALIVNHIRNCNEENYFWVTLEAGRGHYVLADTRTYTHGEREGGWGSGLFIITIMPYVFQQNYAGSMGGKQA